MVSSKNVEKKHGEKNMQFNLSEITFILYEKNSPEKNHLIFTNMFFFQ